MYDKNYDTEVCDIRYSKLIEILELDNLELYRPEFWNHVYGDLTCVDRMKYKTCTICGRIKIIRDNNFNFFEMDKEERE